jgi:hypothetical protein
VIYGSASRNRRGRLVAWALAVVVFIAAPLALLIVALH